MSVTIVLAVLGAIGIAASCGLRAFLPLLALGIAARIGAAQLGASSQWLASDLALWTLGIATVLEILADKIPVLDHALDVIGLALRPIAATFGAFALLQALPTPWSQLVALTLGAGAFGLQVTKAKVRLGSTALTLGHANPLLSVAEDATALAISVAALLVPVAILILLVPVGLMLARGRRAR